MNRDKETKLYQIIIDNSWSLTINNHLEFIYNEATILETDSKKRLVLIDNVLKRILNNLKDNVSIKKFDNYKLDDLSNQYCFDLTIKIIKTYYKNKFIINNEEHSVLNMIFMTIEQNRLSKNYTLFEITSNILHNLFMINYIFYIKKY